MATDNKFISIDGLDHFTEFAKELEEVPKKCRRKFVKSALKRSSQTILRAQKSNLSGVRKRTGYLKRSLKSKFSVSRNKQWQYFSIGIKNPKPYLTKSNARFYKGIKKSGIRYKPRPSTYGGIWLEYGFHPRGSGTEIKKPWFTKSWKDNENTVRHYLEEDVKAVISEIKNLK